MAASVSGCICFKHVLIMAVGYEAPMQKSPPLPYAHIFMTE